MSLINVGNLVLVPSHILGRDEKKIITGVVVRGPYEDNIKISVLENKDVLSMFSVVDIIINGTIYEKIPCSAIKLV
mgnify:CR=1 FL=1|tara:strand:+ start:225 stop:452 length:228 start_codon:yes stop_codon:yes gene_type:complete